MTTTTTYAMLTDHLNSISADLAAIFDAIESEGWLCTTCQETETAHDDDSRHEFTAPSVAESGDDPHDVLAALPLEIVWEVGEPFTVVFSTGGPHTELTGGGRCTGPGYTLTGYWGSQTVHLRSAAISRAGDYYRDLL